MASLRGFGFAPPRRSQSRVPSKGWPLQAANPTTRSAAPAHPRMSRGGSVFGPNGPADDRSLQARSLGSALHGADAPAHAALRPARRARRAHGPVRRLGDAGAVRGRHPGAPRRPHRRRRRSTSRTWARSRSRGRSAHALLQSAALERPRPDRARRGAVHAADERARRDRRRPDRLPARRVPLPARRQRLEPRRRLPLAQGARDPRLRRARRLRRVRAARRAGPARARAARSASRRRRSRSPRRDRRHRGRWSTAPATRARTGCELLCMAEDAVALWDAVLARGAVPCGLGARDTLRLEVCYPLHGNDISPGHRRDLGRARLGVRARQGVHRRRRAPPRQGGGPDAEARRLRDGGEGDPAPGHADRGRRRGHLRLALADARRRHRHGLRAGRAGDAGHEAHDRRARQAARGPRSSRNRSTRGRAEWPPRSRIPTT